MVPTKEGRPNLQLQGEVQEVADFVFASVLGQERCRAGVIEIDGVDLRRIDPKSLRRRVAHLTTSPLVVRGSIRRNLTMGLENRPSDEALSELLERIGASKRLRSLDTTVSASGHGLTRRDRFNLSLCRALLAQPGLLLVETCAAAFLSKRGDHQPLQEFGFEATQITA